VHSRFLPLELPLVLLLAWRIHRESGPRDRRRWLAFLGPLGVLTTAFVTYLRTVWHSFNPSVNQAGDKHLLFGANPAKSLVGVLLDQEHGVLFSYPIFLFVLPGVILAVAAGTARSTCNCSWSSARTAPSCSPRRAGGVAGRHRPGSGPPSCRCSPSPSDTHCSGRATDSSTRGPWCACW